MVWGRGAATLAPSTDGGSAGGTPVERDSAGEALVGTLAGAPAPRGVWRPAGGEPRGPTPDGRRPDARPAPRRAVRRGRHPARHQLPARPGLVAGVRGHRARAGV